jgi:hypothetical protein
MGQHLLELEPSLGESMIAEDAWKHWGNTHHLHNNANPKVGQRKEDGGKGQKVQHQLVSQYSLHCTRCIVLAL